MRIFVKALLLPCLLAFWFPVFSQKRFQPKFGDIKPADFSPTAYAIDSSASGVVLFDIASSKYEGNTSGHFSIAFKRHVRIRLLNRNSFDMATFAIPLYENGSEEERVVSLEATTYNLEDGKIVSYKLDKASVFKDKLNANFTLRKFTLPNIKEGSIIEVRYTFLSPYERYLREWNFQTHYPVLWSEYEVVVPSFYDYAIIKQGYHPYTIDTGRMDRETYNIVSQGDNAASASEHYSFSTNTSDHIWAMKDVPALRKESFTTNLDNHIARIDFQLSKIRYPNEPEKNVMNNWFVLSEDLMKDEDFGLSLTKDNNWINTELKKITAGATTPLETAHKIYTYLRDNMSCTDNTAKYLSNPLKKVYQVKNGNVADINLLLTAFLINAGFEAHPVLLSTRDNGKASAVYPIMDKFNYVISQVKVDDKSILLDASQNKLGFGHLTNECYNGYARVIDKENPVVINLDADSTREYRQTTVFMVNNEHGGIDGTYSCTYGDFESEEMREKIAKSSKTEVFKEIKSSFSTDINIKNETIDSLNSYEEPVTLKYDFSLNNEDDDNIIYVNPVFGSTYQENPFKATERFYPVEMPYASFENYILRMEIPKGYKVEELPKSSRVNLNEGEAMFEFLVSKDEEAIQLRSTVKINKTTFLPEDYQSLRDFYAYIVKKNNEQIVLKKIK